MSDHDHLLFFTSEGRAYCLRAFDVPEGSRTSIGTAFTQASRAGRAWALAPSRRDLRPALSCMRSLALLSVYPFAHVLTLEVSSQINRMTTTACACPVPSHLPPTQLLASLLNQCRCSRG